jgi:membrane fusion protein, multidrug efflux system
LLGGCQNEGKKQAGPPPLPEVTTIAVSTRPVVLTTELPGRTAAFRIAAVIPQVSGLIKKRLFTEGTDVKAGDVLYQIDPAPFKAALDLAEATLAKAQANLPSIRRRADRYRELLAKNAISQQDYDDAEGALKQVEADIRQGKAAIETARINLGYTRITAPISGRIGLSTVTDGALVTAYQPKALTTIQQMDPIYVDLPQSTCDLLRLRRRLAEGGLDQDGTDQNKVKIILEDGTPYAEKGVLQFRDVTVERTTGSVTLRVVCPNPDGILLPGMFVRAVVTEGIREKAVLVPQQAVSRDRKGAAVALIVNAESKIEQHKLTIDRAIGDQWLVTSGITPGMKLLVEGAQRLRPGAKVKAVPFKADENNHDKSAQNGSSGPKSN